jgi:hypothetical protein
MPVILFRASSYAFGVLAADGAERKISDNSMLSST